MHQKTFLKIQVLITVILFLSCSKTNETWKPNTEWGHWRLGQKADLEFLKQNNMTVTFGSGAPNFENVSREEFNQKMEEAKAFNKKYHELGYVVLRYLSTSLNGESESNKDIPKKEQIQLLKFYNENWDDFKDYIGEKPPEDPMTWITVRPDGSFPFYRYAPYGRQPDEGFETWGCPNNPYYVRMMEGRIRAQAETGIDGSYVDWTHIAGGTCYCKFCQQNFIQYLKNNLPADVAQAKYGISDYDNIELPQQRGDKFWMEWITFRCHTVAEFHKRLRTVARQYNPNFMISGNVFGGFGYGPIAYDAAGNMEMLARDGYDDFIYSEMQEFLDSAPRKDDNDTKVTNSPALKFLAAASHGKPTIIYATEITPPIFPDPTEKCLSAMSQINIAEAVANHAIFREKRQTPPGATEMYRFLSANEKYLIGAQLYSTIAVLASLNQYLADERSFAFSTSRVLADQGISHIMIAEDDLLTKNLSQYDLILIPYLPLLSVKKQEALRNYAENGGKLFILGNCGVKNEFNVPLPSSVLATFFEGNQYPAQLTVKEFGEGSIYFMPLAIPDSKFLIHKKVKGEVTTFGPEMADVFPDIPEGYTRNRIDPALRQILSQVAGQTIELLENKASRILQASPYVELSTMLNQKENCLLVHLVNYDVTVDGTITPCKNLKIQIALPDGQKVKSVRYSGAFLEAVPVEFSLIDKEGFQLITFEVDEVWVYGLVVLELE
jgi:hypothetical protein